MRTTTVFVVVLLTVASARTLVCEVFCVPGQVATNGNCHDRPASGDQLASGDSCQHDDQAAFVTTSKTTAGERAHVPAFSRSVSIAYPILVCPTFDSSPPGFSLHSPNRATAVLRI
jgi:hypothetical protein